MSISAPDPKPAPDPHIEWLRTIQDNLNQISGSFPDDGDGTVPHLKEANEGLVVEVINTKPTSRDGVLAQLSLVLLLTTRWGEPPTTAKGLVKVHPLTTKALQKGLENLHIIWPE